MCKQKFKLVSSHLDLTKYQIGRPEADYYGGSGGRSPPARKNNKLVFSCLSVAEDALALRERASQIVHLRGDERKELHFAGK